MAYPCRLRSRLRAALAAGFVWWAVGAAQGCGTTGSSRRAPVALEPMRFEAVPGPGGTRVVETLDPATLFAEAGQAFERGDYGAAARKYTLLVQRFPHSRWVNVARFNGGLSLRRAGRCQDALVLFGDAAKATAGSKDAHDALFQAAECDETLGRWEDADATWSRVLAPEWPRIGALDRLEALARRGRTRRHLGKLAEAERDLLKALGVYRRNMGNLAFHGNRWVSVAQFEVGEIYRELFSSVRFRLPLERMARDLEDKSNYFLKAQNAYLKTVRHHHPELAVAAGHRLGSLYEQFYDDMMGAEVPADLKPQEMDIYFEELKAKVRPLVERAMDIYERNIRMAERMGRGDDAWVDRSRQSLARLKDVLRAEAAQEAEAKVSGTSGQ